MGLIPAVVAPQLGKGIRPAQFDTKSQILRPDACFCYRDHHPQRRTVDRTIWPHIRYPIDLTSRQLRQIDRRGSPGLVAIGLKKADLELQRSAFPPQCVDGCLKLQIGRSVDRSLGHDNFVGVHSLFPRLPDKVVESDAQIPQFCAVAHRGPDDARHLQFIAILNQSRTAAIAFVQWPLHPHFGVWHIVAVQCQALIRKESGAARPYGWNRIAQDGESFKGRFFLNGQDLGIV